MQWGGSSNSNWSVDTNWSITSGTDADGIPDWDDDCYIDTPNLYGSNPHVYDGTGYANSVTVQSGGKLTVSSTLNVDNDSDSSLIVAGGELTVHGTVTSPNGVEVDAGKLYCISYNGTISAGLTILNAASVYVSSGVTLSVGGNVVLDDTSSLNVGVGQSDYGRFSVSGNMTISSSSTIYITRGTMTSSHTYSVVYISGTRTGDFGTVTFLGSSSDYTWTTEWDGAYFKVTNS